MIKIFPLFRISEALKGSFFSIFDQGIVSFSNFTCGIILARALAPEGFGQYSLYLATLMLAAGLQNSLITGPVRVLGVKQSAEEMRSFLQIQFKLQVILNIIIIFFLVSFFYIFKIGDFSLNLIFCICIFLWQLLELSRVINLTQFKLYDLIVIDFTVHAVRLGALLFISFYTSLINNFYAFLILSLSCFCGIILFFIKNKNEFQNQINIDLIDTTISNWKFGRWLLLETLVYNVSTQIYLYLTAMLVDTASVGALSAVQNILNVFNVLLLGLISFITPHARHLLIKQGYDAWKRCLLKVGIGLFSFSLFVCLVISLYRIDLLKFIYSDQYIYYAFLVPICSITLIFRVVNTVFSVAFRTALFPEIGFYSKLFSAVLTIIISYPLLMFYGVIGAAIGLLTTQMIWTVVYVYNLYIKKLKKEFVITRLNYEKN